MGLPAWIIHPPGCRSCQIHGRGVQPTQLMLADTRNMTRKSRLAQCKGLYVPSAPGRTDRARAPCARGRKRQLVRCGSKPISQPVDAVRGTGGHHASSPEHRFYLIQGSTQGLTFSPCHDWRRRNSVSEHRRERRGERPSHGRERHGESLEGEHDAGVGS